MDIPRVCDRHGSPLKQSTYVDVAAYEFSSSIVSWICCRWRFASIVGPPRWIRIFSASSCRPWRTSHQGDSGANGRPIKRMKGKIHWRALCQQIWQMHGCTTRHSQRESVGINICPVSSAPNDNVGHAVDGNTPGQKRSMKMQGCSQLTNCESVSGLA